MRNMHAPPPHLINPEGSNSFIRTIHLISGDQNVTEDLTQNRGSWRNQNSVQGGKQPLEGPRRWVHLGRHAQGAPWTSPPPAHGDALQGRIAPLGLGTVNARGPCQPMGRWSDSEVRGGTSKPSLGQGAKDLGREQNYSPDRKLGYQTIEMWGC